MVGHLYDQIARRAIASVQDLPEHDKEIAAEFLLGFANPDADRHELADEQVREVELAKREAREGKIASDAEMDDVWRRYDR